jgi:hypothetical protein
MFSTVPALPPDLLFTVVRNITGFEPAIAFGPIILGESILRIPGFIALERRV